MIDRHSRRVAADRDLIRALGGQTAVARMLGLTLPGGAQRVNHWLTRGIPAAVKLSRPDIFLTNLEGK